MTAPRVLPPRRHARRGHTPSAAERLVDRVLASGALDAEELAAALLVSPRFLEGVRAGRTRLPAARQLCLALLVEARVPHLRREAANLRGQAAATLSYHARRVGLHLVAPPGRG